LMACVISSNELSSSSFFSSFLRRAASGMV
jgi:hypothetical protein